MHEIERYVESNLLNNPLLAPFRGSVSVVLSGSRAVEYHTPSSDYDFLVLTDSETYAQVAQLAGRSSSDKAVEICRNSSENELGSKVDVSVQDVAIVRSAFERFNDVIFWIWTNAKPIVDEPGVIERLQSRFRGYPHDVLESKMKHHFLVDFHLSVHGLTYRPESKNVFSVVYGLSGKIAEMCKLCCLLDGKPFPYEKWLLRAAEDTQTGKSLVPIFRRVLAILTSLNNDLLANWSSVREATNVIDTEACDILEQALVSWGIDSDWVKNAYDHIEQAIYE